jgi:hypothetical protein
MAEAKVRNDHNDVIDTSALMVIQLERTRAWHEDQIKKIDAALEPIKVLSSMPAIPGEDFRPPKERGKEAFKGILDRIDGESKEEKK